MAERRLTRLNRRTAALRLDALAAEIGEAAGWLDRLGDEHLADRAAQFLECSSRDLLAAAWLLHRGDDRLPDGWLNVTASGAQCPDARSPDVPRA
jgi:hypothetical protein